MRKPLPIILVCILVLSTVACGKTVAVPDAAGATAAASAVDTAGVSAGDSVENSVDGAVAESAGNSADATSGDSGGVSETRVFTDSVGRQVKLPSHIDRIALSGPMAQIVLYALAPEKLVGFSEDWTADASRYIPEEYLALPTIGQLYGGKSEINLEELLATGAQVVIDVGSPKGSITEDLNALQEQTGIPFIHVTMTIENSGDAFRMLGDLLGIPERAEEFAVYCEDTYARTKEIAESVDKKKALYILGDEGLNVIAAGSYHAEVIDLLTDNLAVVDEPSAKGTGNEVDMEQIFTWNPDVIIFAPDSIYGEVSEMPEWQNISAIRTGEYYEVPFGPYNWMGFPPSIQRYLGMLWLSDILYPEKCDYDLREEVVKYYKMFYHCDLTDVQYEELIRNSVK